MVNDFRDVTLAQKDGIGDIGIKRGRTTERTRSYVSDFFDVTLA